MNAWLSFVIVILLQFLLFIFHTYFEKRLSDMSLILSRGILTGVIVGVLSDLVLGKLLGLFSYTLGFSAPFLVLNAVLFYGLFAANILLMQKVSMPHFVIWTLLVAAFTETTNLFLPLWTWKFATLPLLEYVGFLGIGYLGIAVLIAVTWNMFGRQGGLNLVS